MIVKIEDVEPKEIVSGPIHRFQVVVVVGEAKGLLTDDGINWC